MGPAVQAERGKPSSRSTRNAGSELQQTTHEVRFLTLPKTGRIRFALSRSLPSEPSGVTVIRQAEGRYSLSSVAEVPAPAPASEAERTAGVDVGLIDRAVITYSDGTQK